MILAGIIPFVHLLLNIRLWYHHTEIYTPCYKRTPLLLQTDDSDLRYEVGGATCFIT